MLPVPGASRVWAVRPTPSPGNSHVGRDAAGDKETDMRSGPFVRQIQHQINIGPVKSDSVDGGWWPRSRELAAEPPSSTKPLGVRSSWIRATGLRSR